MAKISELLQEITYMEKKIKGLSTKSDRHYVRLPNIEEWRKAGGRELVDPKKLARPPVKLVIRELLLGHKAYPKFGVVVV